MTRLMRVPIHALVFCTVRVDFAPSLFRREHHPIYITPKMMKDKGVGYEMGSCSAAEHTSSLLTKLAFVPSGRGGPRFHLPKCCAGCQFSLWRLQELQQGIRTPMLGAFTDIMRLTRALRIHIYRVYCIFIRDPQSGASGREASISVPKFWDVESPSSDLEITIFYIYFQTLCLTMGNPK